MTSLTARWIAHETARHWARYAGVFPRPFVVASPLGEATVTSEALSLPPGASLWIDGLTENTPICEAETLITEAAWQAMMTEMDCWTWGKPI